MLLLGIFLTQGSKSNPVSSVSCIGRQVLYHWCHLGSPLYFLSHSYCSAGLLATITVTWKGREKTTVCFPNKVGAASRCDGAVAKLALGEWDIRLRNNKSRRLIKLFEEAHLSFGLLSWLRG